jgi:hypothetical protein
MMHEYVLYELQPIEKKNNRKLKLKLIKNIYTFESAVVPVRRPLSCRKSV